MDRTINLEEIIERKRDGRKTPAIVLALLKRFLCLDCFNEIAARGKSGIEFCVDAIEYMGDRIIVEGQENIPSSGCYRVGKGRSI